MPLLALGALEAGLRVGGYGYATSFFKKLSIQGREFLVNNDKFTLKFFPPELARVPQPFRIAAEKPANTCRIFILGESAALGDPEPAYGAGRYLQALLEERFPDRSFEVVNLGLTAVNSQAVLPIARACRACQGDFWIIYTGNNELIGPFGATTVFGPRAPPAGVVRLSLALQETRLGQLLVSLGRRLRGQAGSRAWAGMHMFDHARVPPNSPAREAVYRNFETNLREIVRTALGSGARVILSTVAVNLKDCPPFASLGSTNLPAGLRSQFDAAYADALRFEAQSNLALAAQCYERAANLLPQAADPQFRWGDCLLRLTNTAAGEHFQAACDCDALPFRADSRINGAIRAIAHETTDARLSFCNAAALFATNSPSTVPGQEFFYEHVHLNFDGNYLLARAWAEQVANSLPENATTRATPVWASQQTCEQRLGLTVWNRCAVYEEVLRRLEQPPLNGQSNNPQRRERLELQLAGWRQQMDSPAATRARDAYLAALKRAPEDYFLHEKFADFLNATGDLPGAIVQWQQIHELLPQDSLAPARLGWLFARQRQWASAEAWLLEAADKSPLKGEVWFELGQAQAAQGKLQAALASYKSARNRQADNPFIYYHIAQVLEGLGRRREALGQLRQALRLQPDFPGAYDGLGELLRQDSRLAQARAECETRVREKSDSVPAHLELGMVLLKLREDSKAAQEFQEALRLQPTNNTARTFLRQIQAGADARR